MAVDLNVLFLEDNPNDAELLLHELHRSGFNPIWQRVETQEDYLAHLNDKIDLIIADYSLPSFNAVSALRLLQERGVDIPLIVVTGTVTEDVVVQCIKQGASDYLLKDRLARLSIAVNHALEEKKLRDEKRQAEKARELYAAELEQRVDERTTELQRAKEYVEAILNHTSDAIILTGPDGNIEHVNPAFEELFGYQDHEALGQSLLFLASTDQLPLLDEELQAVRKNNVARRTEMRVQRHDSTVFAAEVALAPMGDQNGLAGIVCSIWDVSARIRVEENLRQALEKEKELGDLKSRFTAMVSHEFRTPLAVIQSSSDLLKSYSEQMTVEKRTGQLEKIELQVRRLTDLLNDILVLGKAQTVGLEFNPERLDIYALSQELINEISSTATTHRFQFTSEGDCTDTYGDAKLLRQAITNLLSNATKYSPADTTVHFRLDCEREQILIGIRDEGAGISEEDQAHLFDAFYRSKSVMSIPGTGLGLPIVKQAIEAHGGTVTCTSEIGHGTTFTLVIPVKSIDGASLNE